MMGFGYTAHVHKSPSNDAMARFLHNCHYMFCWSRSREHYVYLVAYSPPEPFLCSAQYLVSQSVASLTILFCRSSVSSPLEPVLTAIAHRGQHGVAREALWVASGILTSEKSTIG